MSRLLIIEPQGGLANRLRTILTAAALAEEGERALRVLWRVTPGEYGMRAKLGEVFATHPPEVAAVPSGSRSVVQPGGTADLATVDPCGPEAVLHVQSCYPLASTRDFGGAVTYSKGRYGIHKPLRALTKRAAGWFEGLFGLHGEDKALVKRPLNLQCVGVHVRRGDNLWAAEAAPLQAFEKVLMRHSGRRLWLSTDSSEVETWFSERYGVSWFHKKRAGDTRGAGAVREALVDLLLLSRTVTVVGSCHSSFGPLAASLGGVPFQIVGPVGGAK